MLRCDVDRKEVLACLEEARRDHRWTTLRIKFEQWVEMPLA